MPKLCLDAGGAWYHRSPASRSAPRIKPQDVTDLAKLLEKYPDAEFNIEGNPFIDYMHHIERVRPTQATLVPDSVEGNPRATPVGICRPIPSGYYR